MEPLKKGGIPVEGMPKRDTLVVALIIAVAMMMTTLKEEKKDDGR